jgi:hypothetical protein
MISVENWWAVIANYNLKIFPVQIILYLVSFILTRCFFIKPGKTANVVMKIYFSLSFSWIGVVLFFLLGKDFKLYIPQVIVFMSLAVLFLLIFSENELYISFPKKRV